jgi:hypothetical protein
VAANYSIYHPHALDKSDTIANNSLTVSCNNAQRTTGSLTNMELALRDTSKWIVVRSSAETQTYVVYTTDDKRLCVTQELLGSRPNTSFTEVCCLFCSFLLGFPFSTLDYFLLFFHFTGNLFYFISFIYCFFICLFVYLLPVTVFECFFSQS